MTTDISGHLNGALPSGMRVETLRGEPRPVGGALVTPISRRLSLRWPRGGWVYAWPVGVETQSERGTQRTRIVPVRALALAALAGVALAALASLVTQRWLNQRQTIQDSARRQKRSDTA